MTSPQVHLVEEGMREGLQIESADISVDEKLRLLDALSRTGLKTIVVGSYVSPKWCPQMADTEELVARMRPADGVTYTALALNRRGRERMLAQSPPLSERAGAGRTLVHLCDVFAQRNTNRTQQQEIAAWEGVVADAVAHGTTEATIALNAAWGSNWTGDVAEETRLDLLEAQHQLWTDAGIPVTRVWLGDPMGWNLPHVVERHLRNIMERWPSITTFHLHLHDARGAALLSAYSALRVLTSEHTLVLDTSIGGMGGCPYCGHGRITRMIPTEDVVDLLEELGVKTGVDLPALIEAAHVAESVVGHPLWGHVSKAGPRPRGNDLYAMDMPFVETEEQAQHFRLGPTVYEGALSPWKSPITSPMRSQ
ncbi:citramalate synthase [Nocardioides zeae]|uniref:Hydroxymethylglutaryl-CoA lyase n=1 Tax=Nocardioides zeae TaxID=1457234 RepID=A0AAJ1U8Y3_9ACTN|nr:citramalate synthase [Nocardioides zeae]MDQ1105702.1 hydroxymethylglutaryl-CoA lyase [Nocardioides zeae]